MGQGKIIVNGLGHVHHVDPTGGPGFQLHGAVGRVVATDGNQLVNIQAEEGGDGVLQVLGALGGVVPGDADVRSASEVDATYGFGREGLRMGDVPLHDPRESVVDAHYFDALVVGPERGRADHAIDPGGGATSHENGHILWLVHSSSAR